MIFYFFAMSVLLLSILGVSSSLQHCAMWKDIVPCTCRLETSKLITLNCDKMKSFENVAEILRGHFSPADKVSLRVGSSNLIDLQFRAFKELNMTIENLKLNHDYMGNLNPETFDGLTRVSFLSLSDNNLEVVPEHLWAKMPNVRTLDLGRTKIKELSGTNFVNLPNLECITLPGNQISRMDSDSIPARIKRLHLGRNYLKHLNNTLRNLTDLGWLFVNSNDLTTLDGQLPKEAPNFKLIHASHNKIQNLPQELKAFTQLESMFFQNNKIKSLDGALSKSRNLIRIVLEHNEISKLTEDDFAESELLESLLLGHNHISNLNNSLSSLKNLNFLNLTYNYLTEFSFQEIVGLQELMSIDLSHNKISTVIGPIANLVDWDFKLTELKLDHNNLEILNGALSGLSQLNRLNLSFNKLRKISPDDFMGLDELKSLDVSHNQLTTLEETSKTYLPKLSELKATDNFLTILDKDFDGLPVLCLADLSNNQIVALGKDLVAKTRCRIEHGVHEGTWDILKIYLQDNPILCDAALPEIVSFMEINHTRIIGVSHCPPLSEQPTTSKPNAFLGYIRETTPPVPTGSSIKYANDGLNKDHIEISIGTSSLNNHNNYEIVGSKNIHSDLELGSKVQYEIETNQAKILHNIDPPIAVTFQKSNIALKTKQESNQHETNEASIVTLNPIGPSSNILVEQGQRINELASKIEKLQSQLDVLLDEQLSKNITEHRKP